jgi:lipoic acid synthetase
VEVLAPDFRGDQTALNTLLESGLHVFAHNIETVERLQSSVRDRRANYEQSLNVLARAKQTHPQVVTKSSLMLGLGESLDEIKTCLADLRRHKVDAITFGQYLQPSPKHLKVTEWVEPAVFDELKRLAEEDYGFAYCASGPLVRSSYKAGEYFMSALVQERLAMV